MKIKIVISDVRSINRNGKITGHYVFLAQNYMDVLAEGFDVYIAGGPIYKNKFKNYLALPFDTNPFESEILNKVKVIWNCISLFHKAKGYKIILQSNAVVTTFFAIMIYPWKRDLFMIQYNTMALDSKIKRMLHRFSKKKIKGILCPSDDIGKQYGTSYLVLPDYIVTKKQVDALGDLLECKKCYDICIVGIVTPDKGVVQAAKVLAKTNYRILIAGRPVNKEIEEELRTICYGRDNITLRLEYIDDATYDTCIKQSHYCMLNYSDAYSEHSSGVIFDALYRGVPIIGRRCRFLQCIEDEKMGYLYNDIENCDFTKLLASEQIRKYELGIKRYVEKELAVKDKLCAYLRDTE